MKTSWSSALQDVVSRMPHSSILPSSTSAQQTNLKCILYLSRQQACIQYFPTCVHFLAKTAVKLQSTSAVCSMQLKHLLQSLSAPSMTPAASVFAHSCCASCVCRSSNQLSAPPSAMLHEGLHPGPMLGRLCCACCLRFFRSDVSQ